MLLTDSDALSISEIISSAVGVVPRTTSFNLRSLNIDIGISKYGLRYPTMVGIQRLTNIFHARKVLGLTTKSS